MATDGPDPTPCDAQIFEKGKVVFIGDSVSSNAMERWVKRVAEVSGEPVDWHFAGGRALVKTTGDLKKVKLALDSLKEEYAVLRKRILVKRKKL